MKKFNLISWCLLLCAIGIGITACTENATATNATETVSSHAEPRPVVRHVVSFQFKEDISEERKTQAIKDFLALKDRITEIETFEGGTNISIEDHAKGFTHCYILTFGSEADRDTYVVHPAHLEVAEKNKPLMQDLFVFDFMGEE